MSAPAVQTKGSAVQDLELIVTPHKHLGVGKEVALLSSDSAKSTMRFRVVGPVVMLIIFLGAFSVFLLDAPTLAPRSKGGSEVVSEQYASLRSELASELVDDGWTSSSAPGC